MELDKDYIKSRIINKRILSIDYGLKRVGLAYCDPMHIVITTYKTINNDDYLINHILEVIENQNFEIIVIGIPIRLDNSENEVSISIREFKEELSKLCNNDIFLYDESYTSINAQKIQLQNGTKMKKRRDKSQKDKIAAALILQSFLEEYN